MNTLSKLEVFFREDYIRKLLLCPKARKQMNREKGC